MRWGWRKKFRSNNHWRAVFYASGLRGRKVVLQRLNFETSASGFRLRAMKNIAVIGSGTMGNGIAHVFAQMTYKVALIDTSEEALKKALITIEKNLDRQLSKQLISEEVKKATLNNITTYTNIKAGVAEAD